MDRPQGDIASSSGVSRPTPGGGAAAGAVRPPDEGLLCSPSPAESAPSSPRASWALKTFPWYSISSSVNRFRGTRALREDAPWDGQIKFSPKIQARLELFILLKMLSRDTWRTHGGKGRDPWGPVRWAGHWAGSCKPALGPCAASALLQASVSRP